MQAEQQSAHLRFKEWANGKGYDTAHTYDTERSRWVFFNPMTADLWESWRAALSHPSTPQGWQPIETAPTNVQVVALYKGKIPVIAHKNAPNDSPSGWCHLNAGGPAFDAPHRGLTHWQPLPPTPEQGGPNA